ncbi:MAG: excinuclease ABC subunit UvrC [Prevotellaceae bacterium]|nr:excinuclease ABC subunit UvrC [Prevotellaceae bacterium]
MGNKAETLKQSITTLPEKPGVYQYFNAKNEILYVGKAKNLRKRVASYFNKRHDDNPKLQVLVRQIDHLQYIVVDTESDALLLENNLIKKYLPRYNAMLKDDKTYPSICINNDSFPRVFKTRKIIKNGSQYFGPYSNVYTLETLLQLIKGIYKLRTCRLPLNEEKIRKHRFKVCLEYHIKNCTGVCEGYQSAEDYRKNIDEIAEILKGNANSISKLLLVEIKKLADEYRFEEAHELKEKYDHIENYKSKSLIANAAMDDTDVFGYDEDESAAYIGILRISKGCVVQGYTIEYKKKLDEEREELLALAVVELREKLQSTSKNVLLPFDLEITFPDFSIKTPRKSDEKKLLELARQNVAQHKLDRLKQAEKLNPDQRAARILTNIQNALKLPKIPMHIECFDNSNIQGTSAVASCVVFRKGKPAKQDYRHFNIKTVVGADDYASMKEVVSRRYSRMLTEGTPLPDLIITDGGRGQMEVVRQVIEDELHLEIPIAGLAKDKRHRTSELLFGFPPKEIGMKPTDELFKLLAQIQDEAHRFAITHHKNKRSKAQIGSSLDEIKGIGAKTKEQLLLKFKSVKRISEATLEELTAEIGEKRAEIIAEFYRQK